MIPFQPNRKDASDVDQSDHRPIDWDDEEEVLRWIAAKLGARHRPLMLRFLRAIKVPSGLTKRFWGGGARLQKMPGARFTLGLLAALAEPRIRRAVARAWCALNYDVANRIMASRSRWAIGDDLSADGWDFLATRGPLSIDVLVAARVAERFPSKQPTHLRRLAAGERCVYASAPMIDGAQILDDARNRLDMLAVETLGAQMRRAVHEPFFDDALAVGDYDAVVRHLEGVGGHALLNASYFRYVQGDIDAAEHYSEAAVADGVAGAEATVLRVLVLLARGQASDALDILESSPATLRERGATIRAMLELALDAPDRAALALCDEVYGEHSLRVYPLVLCGALLSKLGRTAPDELIRILGQGWCTADERSAAVAAVRASLHPTERGAEPKGLMDASLSLTAEPVPDADRLPNESERAVHVALRPLLELGNQYRSLTGEVARATGANDWKSLGRLAEELQRLESEIASRVREVEASLDPKFASGRLISPDASTLASCEKFAAWIEVVEAAIVAERAQATRALEQAKQDLGRDLLHLGLDVPEELSEATGLERIMELREEFASEITIRRAVARVQSGGLARARLHRLSPVERLEVYRILEQTGSSAELLECLLADETLTDACRDEAAALVLTMTCAVLGTGERPPHGAFRYLMRNLDDHFSRMAKEGLFEAAAGIASLDIRELAEVCRGNESHLPAVLRNRVELHFMRERPAEQRLPHLASLLEAEPNDVAVQRAVFETLLELGRHGEALYLAGLLIRTDSDALMEDAARDTMLRVLMSPELFARKPESVVAVLRDWAWWLERDDLVVTLLFLLRTFQLADDIINLRFAESEAIDAAARRFPKLVDYLLEPNRNTASQDIITARMALNEFRAELARESCYSSWSNAIQYQIHFRQILEATLAKLDAGCHVDLRPNIERIIDEGATDGVPAAIGAARRAMVRFLQEQFERLRIVARVLPGRSLDDLEGPIDEWRDSLSRELQQAGPVFPLNAVYRRCIEEAG